MAANLKKTIIRVIILMVGLTIAHLGVTLFLLADLGSDPFNVLIQGLFRTIQKIADISWLTHGNVHMAICFLIIIILLIVDFSFVAIGFALSGSFGIGTIVCAFLVGPVAGFFLPRNEKVINRIVGRF